MSTPRRPVIAADERRLDDILRHGLASSAEGVKPTAARELFPDFVHAREVGRGTYVAATRDGDELVVLRILPARHFGDPRQHARYSSNLDRSAHVRDEVVVGPVSLGATCDDRAFLARPHIDGVPIDVYARGEAFGGPVPDLPDLLRLFVRVCRAIEHAHQAGVLHGGLKPANVLINAAGVPRIVDFGISLATAADRPDDVAALGRMLFDLLRDRPVGPDSALTAIATRSVASEVGQRYDSAAALADDLERYLDGKRLSIQPPGFFAMAEPWLARHAPGWRTTPVVGSAVGVVVGCYTVWADSLGQTLFATLWLTAALAGASGMGLLAARLGRARTWLGAAWCGTAAGLTAGIVGFACGAGGTIGQWVTAPALRDVERMAQVAGGSDAAQTADIAARARQKASRAAALAVWLGGTLPILLGTTFGYLGALAWYSSRHTNEPSPGNVLTYFDMSLPGQAALAVSATWLVGFASGTGTIPWFAGPALVILALAVGWAVRRGVPSPTRGAVYLAGLALLCRAGGRPLPWWTETLAYVGSIAFLTLAWMPGRSRVEVRE